VEGFQNPNMEDIMDACTGWESEFVGDVANLLNHLEWPCIVGAELAFGARKERTCVAVE